MNRLAKHLLETEEIPGTGIPRKRNPGVKDKLKPAVKAGDEVFTDYWHGGAWDQATDAGYPEAPRQTGWVDYSGVFIDNDEAERRTGLWPESENLGDYGYLDGVDGGMWVD